MRKIVFALLAILAAYSSSNGQITFSKTYNGGQIELGGYDVQQMPSDYGYVTNIFDSSGRGGLLKVDSLGDSLWVKLIPTQSGFAQISHILLLKNNNLGLLAYGDFPHTWVIKTNSNGDTIWTRLVSPKDTVTSNNISQTFDNGIAVLACFNEVSKSPMAFLEKFDSNGNALWQKKYTDTTDFSDQVQSTYDKGFIIGLTHANNLSLLKTNSTGDSIWQKTYNNIKNWQSTIISLVQNSDSGYTILAEADSVYNREMELIRTTSNGDTLFRKYYKNIYCSVTSLVRCSDGGYAISGIQGKWDDSVVLIKLDKMGNLQWAKFYWYFDDYGYSVRQTSDSGFILSAGLGMLAFSPRGLWLIKTDGDGNLTGLPSISLIRSNFNLYPNPFSDELTISFKDQSFTNSHLEILNLQGQTVFESNLSSATYTVSLERLAAGLYFARMIAGNNVSVQKIVKQ